MAKKAAIVSADQLVTHNHWHQHPGQRIGATYNGDVAQPAYLNAHGHWHPHDARDKERHEHQHSTLDVWPHDGCMVEQLPPEPPKATGDKPRRKKKQPVA